MADVIIRVQRQDLDALYAILVEAEEDTAMFLREAQDADETRRLKHLARKIARWLKIIGEQEA